VRLHRTVSSQPRHALELSVLVVDDGSPDRTAEVVRREAAKYPGRLRVFERRGERGLAVSVIDGLARTSAPVVLVMDADLSHRPEEIPALLAPIRGGHADLVVGSRYIEGGSTADGWGLLRRLNSSAAVLLARALTPLSDPMSGFFAFSRAVLEKAPHLNPTGYKILLELLVKTRPARVLEVPIRFEKRGRGKSKLTLREQILYLRHLGRLHAHAFPGLLELARFAAVGASGVVVDLLLLTLLVSGLAVPFALARVLSFLAATASNFALNRAWTFRGRGKELSALEQLTRYVLGAGAARRSPPPAGPTRTRTSSGTRAAGPTRRAREEHC
jgi:dolichol-phosphate mannosyltransferase